jgi:hypothetical protein
MLCRLTITRYALAEDVHRHSELWQFDTAAILYAGTVQHATQDDIDRLEAQLAELRRLARLCEREHGYFRGDQVRPCTP